MWTGEPEDERLVDRQVRVETDGLVLREVLQDDLVAEGAGAGVGFLDARQHAHERRLARAVGAEERDAVAALDEQVDPLEDPRRAVRLVHALQVEHHPPALLAGREREMDALALGRHLDGHDLVEHLDPVLHLGGLGGGVPEPVDEHLDPCDFLVLPPLGVAQPLEALVALHEVLGVVAVVVDERAQVDVGDAIHHGVEEEPVVRHENHRVRVVVQVLLEPVPRVEIEVVGRLVEEEQVGLRQQQLREGDAHLPAARECRRRLVVVGRAEPEPLQHRVDLQVDRVAVVQPEAILQVAVAVQHHLVLAFGHGRVGQALLDRLHLPAHIQQPLEGEGRFLVQRVPLVRQPVLGQIAHPQAGRCDDGAGIGLIEVREDAEQRRLARAVRPAEPHRFAVRHLPGHVLEEDPGSERLGDRRQLDHGGARLPGPPRPIPASAQATGARASAKCTTPPVARPRPATVKGSPRTG